MKKVFFCCFLLGHSLLAGAQDITGKDYSKPESTEMWEPVPAIVTPGKQPGTPPSDAIILFDGRDLDSWITSKDGSPCQWELGNGMMTIKTGTGDIQTRQKFGDCQLHIEFMLSPDEESAGHYNAGNSGVYLQERYEVQIYNSYQDKEKIYANGQCGSLYKQAIPMANACSKPGEWNTYDIYYTAPEFRYNGSVEKPAYITVVHNGVLILNHFEIEGAIQHAGIPQYEPHDKAALKLQEHGSKVSFRNIWIREL